MRELERELPWLSPPRGGLDRLRAALDAPPTIWLPGFRLAGALALSAALVLMFHAGLGRPSGSLEMDEARRRLAVLAKAGLGEASVDRLHLIAETEDGVRVYLAMPRPSVPASQHSRGRGFIDMPGRAVDWHVQQENER